MTEFGALMVWLAPLTLLAMISPVVFLNATTVATNAGAGYRWRFVGGNAFVLLALGTLAMGLFGAAAQQATVRELSSRWVDALLAGLLLVLAVTMIHGLLSDRARDRTATGTPDASGDPSAASPTAGPRAAAAAGAGPASLPRSPAGWGAIGMAANLPTIALYVAMATRIGVTDLPLPVRIGVLAIVTALVLVPVWAPIVLATVAPGHAALGPQAVQRVSSWSRVFAAVASLAGAIYLAVRALTG